MMTATWLLVVLVDEKIVRLPGHRYELPAIILVAFASFAWVNRGLMPGRRASLRALCVAAAASALTAAWLPITVLCALQFVLMIGGTL